MQETDPGWPGPKPGNPFRLKHLLRYKEAGVALTMLTSYDSMSARIFDEAGIDLLLVGDSYGTTALGFDSTTKVDMDDMTRATASVARATKRALIVADLPFGSYEASPTEAVRNAVTLIRAGANAVKLEGGKRVIKQVKAIVDSGIAVIGHLGFTPQSENALGGKVMQGRGDQLQFLLDDALALSEAKVSAIVLEMVPDKAVVAIREKITTPLIGIGAGPHTDGQVLVWADMAAMSDWYPSFAKIFAQVGKELSMGAKNYISEVRSGTFPAPQHYRSE